jgi:hypothetical protein
VPSTALDASDTEMANATKIRNLLFPCTCAVFILWFQEYKYVCYHLFNWVFLGIGLFPFTNKCYNDQIHVSSSAFLCSKLFNFNLFSPLKGALFLTLLPYWSEFSLLLFGYYWT